MPIKMKPISVITADLGLQDGGPVHAFFTATCAKTMDKYVPYRNGRLIEYVIEDNKYIRYNKPYAHYMYEGKVMGPNIPIKQDGVIVGWFSKKPKHYTGKEIKYNQSSGHEYAGPRWDKRMWSTDKEKVIKQVQDYIDNGGK